MRSRPAWRTSCRPFSGRAGRFLFRWLEAAGLGDEESARRTVYLTSITKCFPGPSPSGAGDRRPSPAEVDLCRGHLESQLALLRPWLIVAVGQMALERFLGPLPMHLAVGELNLGERRLFTGTAHDITDRVRVEAELRDPALCHVAVPAWVQMSAEPEMIANRQCRVEGRLLGDETDPA